MSEQLFASVDEAHRQAADLRSRLTAVEEQFAAYRVAADELVRERDAQIEALNEKHSNSAQALTEAREDLVVLQAEHSKLVATHTTTDQLLNNLRLEHERTIAQTKRLHDELAREQDHHQKCMEQHAKEVRRLQGEVEEAVQSSRVIIREPGDQDQELHDLRVQLEEQRAQAVFDIERARVERDSAVEARERLAKTVVVLEQRAEELEARIVELEKPRPANTARQDAQIDRLTSDLRTKVSELATVNQRYVQVTGLADQKEQDNVDLRRENTSLREQVEGLKTQLVAANELREVSTERVARLDRRVAELEQELTDERDRRRRDDTLKEIGRG